MYLPANKAVASYRSIEEGIRAVVDPDLVLHQIIHRARRAAVAAVFLDRRCQRFLGRLPRFHGTWKVAALASLARRGSAVPTGDWSLRHFRERHLDHCAGAVGGGFARLLRPAGENQNQMRARVRFFLQFIGRLPD